MYSILLMPIFQLLSLLDQVVLSVHISVHAENNDEQTDLYTCSYWSLEQLTITIIIAVIKGPQKIQCCSIDGPRNVCSSSNS